MMLGVGIGLGFVRRAAPFTSRLLVELQATGVNIARLWSAESTVTGSNGEAVSCPSLVGTGDLTGLYQYGATGFTITNQGGRQWWTSPDAGWRCFTTPQISFKSVWHVAIPTVPFTSYGALIRARGGIILTESTQGSSNLRAPSGGRLTYVDGVQTAAVTSASRVFETSGATAVTAVCDIGGPYDGAFSWVGKHALHMLLTDEPTAEQRAAVVALLRRHYSV